jgi:hypothetical protein
MMADHVQMLREQRLGVPPPNPNPTVLLQNERKLVKSEGAKARGAEGER